MNLIDQINQHKYLELDELGEPDENVLRIVVSEAIVSEETEDLNTGYTIISGLHPIISDETCCSYEFIFDHYVAYAVLNFSYADGDPNDPNNGLLLRTYPTSEFLDYVRQTTIATEVYPGRFVHYKIVCLRHVIEVASVSEPLIAQIVL